MVSLGFPFLSVNKKGGGFLLSKMCVDVWEEL